MTVLSRACLLIMREKNYNRLKSKRGESSAVTISMAQETDPEQVFEVLERMGEG